MAEITFSVPISELVTQVKAGKVSAHDLVSASLAKIKDADDYHAILETNPEALHKRKAFRAHVLYSIG